MEGGNGANRPPPGVEKKHGYFSKRIVIEKGKLRTGRMFAGGGVVRALLVGLLLLGEGKCLFLSLRYKMGLSARSVSQASAGDHACRTRALRDPFFSGRALRSKHDSGLVSWRRACFRLVCLFFGPRGLH